MRAGIAVTVISLAGAACAAVPAGRPHGASVITDDQGSGGPSCHGSPVLRTPNPDRLRDDTAPVSLTDDGGTFGPQHFNAGMTEGRTILWEGGHRVPCVVRWPAATLLAAGDMSGLTQRLSQPARPVKLILDTDMSDDCDDAGTLAMLHALADRGECDLVAVVTNRRDLANASAAAVDSINTFYGRPDLPLGVGREPPTALERTSRYTPALRDGFPHDVKPDDEMPDAIDVYRTVLAAQPDGSVTICGVGAFSNLAELCRREPDLVKRKVERLVVMGGQFPPRDAAETNIATHPAAAAHVARAWPTEIVWQGFEVGDPVITGKGLNDAPRANPVRRAYELRRFAGRSAIDGGQPSYDQAAALYAVRGPDPELWREERSGTVTVDDTGLTRWEAGTGGRHVLVHRACGPKVLAGRIESLMTAAPAE